MDLSGGGHSIKNDTGTVLTTRNNLQFKGTYSKDNSTSDSTEVEVTRTMTYNDFMLLSAEEKKGVINVTDETGVAFSADDIPYDTNNSVKDVLDEANYVVAVNGNTDYINGTDKAIFYVKFGRLVVFSGRFSITTEKPSGQGAYLFTDLPEPIALTSVNETSRNDIILVKSDNKGWITSNNVIPTGNYNVFGAYISKN